MTKFIIIGLGGFIGAIMRYSLSGFAQNLFQKSHTAIFPIGTMFVNVVGCFLIGFSATLLFERTVDPAYRLLINVGFLGAFTTFSTFSLETLALIEESEFGYAFLNVFVSCLIGLIAVWMGRVLFRLIWG